MSLAQITEKILGDARDEAAQIISDAKAKAEEIAKKANDEAEAVRAAFERRFQIERPEIFHRREIVADLDVKKMMLGARRAVISDVYAAALKKLVNMDEKAYLDFCAALMDEAVLTKEEEVGVAADEKYINGAWIEKYNKRRGTKLTLSDARPDISGGFILTRGRISINCSWDMLLQAVREKQEAEVVKRLFPTAE